LAKPHSYILLVLLITVLTAGFIPVITHADNSWYSVNGSIVKLVKNNKPVLFINTYVEIEKGGRLNPVLKSYTSSSFIMEAVQGSNLLRVTYDLLMNGKYKQSIEIRSDKNLTLYIDAWLTGKAHMRGKHRLGFMGDYYAELDYSDLAQYGKPTVRYYGIHAVISLSLKAGHYVIDPTIETYSYINMTIK
jgi:hypothetical protein